MIREELEDNNSRSSNTIRSLHQATDPFIISNTSLRQEQDENERSRSSSGMKTNQY